ncbi:MAG TPA: DUF1345 domain-containing protein [Chloroflexota bacterium]|nr:DUF1345 domain-containing protein [Chloroflexota bacterium]
MTALSADQPESEHPRIRRWEASAAALVAALLFIPLPQQINTGRGWLPSILVVLLLIPLTMVQSALHRKGGWDPSPRLLRLLALAVLGLIALAEAIVLGRLLWQLPHISQGTLLFRAAILIWAINILVFALCYWELDGGGPGRRARDTDAPGDFLFPQQMNEKLNQGWAPEFLDYLFLAFNTATAFSPTDTMILSRSAKALMMTQSSTSLLTVVLVVGRGVNII